MGEMETKMTSGYLDSGFHKWDLQVTCVLQCSGTLKYFIVLSNILRFERERGVL